jgi:hypothetical protein
MLRRGTFLLTTALAAATSLFAAATSTDDRFSDIPAIAAKIDELTARHWSSLQIEPAPPAGDSELLRRLTLDIAGRVPTEKEARAFAADSASDKREHLIHRLIDGPEFNLHFGRVLEELIQQDRAGNRDFLEFLRAALRENRGWDDIYRTVLVGPWDDPRQQAATRFLSDRVKSVDEMTADTGRAFFGVDISCAKCHDHPHVDDWKQRNYYGMVSFFKPTQITRDKGKQKLFENDDREVKFRDTEGKEHVVRPTFLSGKEFDSQGSPRETLVREGLADPVFFRRAIVNQVWAYLFGRGLVAPVDQMHSANEPAIEGLLEWLADDLAAREYDLRRLVAGIVSSRAYQLTSAWPTDRPRPEESTYAVAQVRPLSPEQLSLSLTLVTTGGLDDADNADDREKKYRDLERRSGALVEKRFLDGRGGYQASVAEAMFMSNHAEIQKLFEPSPGNLTRRLLDAPNSSDNHALVESAIWAIFGRPAHDDERQQLADWLASHSQNRQQALAQLLWSLSTSSEFRFNH